MDDLNLNLILILNLNLNLNLIPDGECRGLSMTNISPSRDFDYQNNMPLPLNCFIFGFSKYQRS
jgi:hypothetical protein